MASKVELKKKPAIINRRPLLERFRTKFFKGQFFFTPPEFGRTELGLRDFNVKSYDLEIKIWINRSMIMMGIYYRYGSALKQTFENQVMGQQVSPDRFFNNLLQGMDFLSDKYFGKDPYYLLNKLELTPKLLEAFYHLGRVHNNTGLNITDKLNMASLLGQSINRPGMLDLLANNLHLLAMSFSYLRTCEVSQARQKKADQEALKALNQELNDLFKFHQQIRDRLAKDQAGKKVEITDNEKRVLEKLIELGEIVESVREAVAKQNPAELAKTILKIVERRNGKVEIEVVDKVPHEIELKRVIGEALKAEPEIAVPLLIEAIVELKMGLGLTATQAAKVIEVAKGLIKETLRPAARNQVAPAITKPQTIEVVAQDTIKPAPRAIIQPTLSPEQTKVVAQLVKQTISAKKQQGTVEKYYHDTKVAVVSEIIRTLPEALPEIIKAISPEPKPVKRAINWLLNLIGVKTQTNAKQELKSIVIEAIKTPAGQDQVLTHVVENQSRPEVYSLEPAKQVEQLQLLHNIARQTVRQVISNKTAVVFSPRESLPELREIIAALSEVNKIKPNSLKLRRRGTPKTLLAVAVKILQFTDLLRHGQIEEAIDQRNLLEKINKSRSPSQPKIPGLELIKVYLEAEAYKNIPVEARAKVRMISGQIPTELLDYEIVKATNGHIPAAQRVKEVIDAFPKVRQAIENFNQVQRATEDVARIEFIIKYAYCFLAPLLGKPEADILKELDATLAADQNWSKLYVALQVLPDVVKSEIKKRRWKEMRERMNEIVLFSEGPRVPTE